VNFSFSRFDTRLEWLNQPLRSLLYVPTDSPRKLAKSRTVFPDALIFDLEDAVAPDRKNEGRALLLRELADSTPGRTRICVRINSPRANMLNEDLSVAVHPLVNVIVLPKCEEPEEIRFIDTLIRDFESRRSIPKGRIKLLLILESAVGVLRVQDLSRSSERVFALSFGPEDYAASMGVCRSRNPDEFLVPRSLVAMAAHATRVQAIGGVFTDLNDEAGLIEDIQRAKQLGFTAKTLIHPRQIGPVHLALRPSIDEEAWARTIVDAFENAKLRGTGVLVVNGRMVDEPVLLQANWILRCLEAST